MKKITLLLLNFQPARQRLLALITAGGFLIFNSSAQAPNWLWANKAGGSGLDGASAVAVDASGNTYITGLFSSPTITFGSTTLTNASIATDIFVAKYDAAGNALWAKRAGGTSGDNGNGIAVDGSGNCYVTGMFMSTTISFDTITLTNAGSGGQDFFIVKLDASGNALWAKRAGGIGSDVGNSVAADASGNSYVTGGFASSSITFGSTTLSNANFVGGDIFIVKYDASGNVLWAMSAGGTGDETGMSITADGSGNSYITGSFSSTSLTFGSTTLVGTGGNFYIAKFDGSGSALWAASASGGQGVDIAVDGSGNSYACGSYPGTSITFGSTTLTNAGNTDLFVTKYNAAGNAVWAADAGGPSYEGANSVGVDGSGDIFINGYFQSASITLGTATLNNVGSSDVLVAKYSSAGNVLWATGIGGNDIDLPSGIAVDGSGNSYSVGGFYSASIAFGSTTLTNAAAGSRDMFIAKLSGVVGINEISGEENTISLFPNPATNELRIENAELKIKKVGIYNTLGENVFQSQISNLKSQISIDISQLPSGIYFLKVRGENRERVAKFVKQ